jgi:hypothetical protein
VFDVAVFEVKYTAPAVPTLEKQQQKEQHTTSTNTSIITAFWSI